MNLMLHEQAVLNDSAEQALSCTSLSLSVLLTAVVSCAVLFFVFFHHVKPVHKYHV